MRGDKSRTSKNAEKWHNFWFYGLFSIKRRGFKKIRVLHFKCSCRGTVAGQDPFMRPGALASWSKSSQPIENWTKASQSLSPEFT